MRKALTLIELLAAITIVLLLAAILLPVFGSARIEGHKASSTSNLRQIGLALMNYREAEGGWPPYTLDSLVVAGHLTDTRLLLEPLDSVVGGFAKRLYECDGQALNTPRTPTSYEDVFSLYSNDGQTYIQLFLDDYLLPVDSNPGLLAVRIFGERREFDASSCRGLQYAYFGSVLRLRLDGSVQRARFVDQDEDGGLRYCRPALFTDIPPDVVCRRVRTSK